MRIAKGPIARVSLADAIRAELREQILSGELSMGMRITEQQVAESMGTSAGPVREAFASLAFEGLLISLPNRGTFVSSVSEEEARGAYGVRLRVEAYAFELARERLTQAAYTQLEDLVERLKRAAEASDYAAMIGIDMQFHGIFYAHSGNPILIAMWPLLEGTIRKFVTVVGPSYVRDLVDLARRHEQLLIDYRRGDMDAVARELAQNGQDIWRHLARDGKPEPQPVARSAAKKPSGKVRPSKLSNTALA